MDTWMLYTRWIPGYYIQDGYLDIIYKMDDHLEKILDAIAFN